MGALSRDPAGGQDVLLCSILSSRAMLGSVEADCSQHRSEDAADEGGHHEQPRIRREGTARANA